jgi:hypothetical protein
MGIGAMTTKEIDALATKIFQSVKAHLERTTKPMEARISELEKRLTESQARTARLIEEAEERADVSRRSLLLSVRESLAEQGRYERS